MPTYQVTLMLTVAGIGEMAGRVKPILRTVIAADIEKAVEAACKDIMIIEAIKVEKVPDVG